MFRKNKPVPTNKIPTASKSAVPSVIAKDFHLLGNVISDGVVDFDGKIDGNIRCDTLNVRKNATINGEIVANDVFVYGSVKGIIRAKNVYLYNGSRIEGIVMHESISIEDGAFLDGKCKRTDKPQGNVADSYEFEETTSGDVRMLENIKLIGS